MGRLQLWNFRSIQVAATVQVALMVIAAIVSDDTTASILLTGAGVAAVLVVINAAGMRRDARLLQNDRTSLLGQLEEAETMGDELVGVVSHELRTPLTSIIGFMEMLQDFELSPDESSEYMDHVRRQAGRLQFLVENLLNYRRANHADEGTTDVAMTVEDVIDQQSGYPGADEFTFHTFIADGLQASTSERALRLVVANLVNNAVKYGTKGSDITVTAMSVVTGDIAHTEIAVSNEGPPICSSDQQRMFEAFVQLDPTVTRRVPGVGLGLHIVGQTVSAYDGSIDVACTDGRVTFTVRFPRVSVHAAA